MRHRRAPRPLSEILSPLAARLEPAAPLARIQSRWSAVVGEAVAAHAVPVGERDGVLEVLCDGSVWASELDLMSGEIIGALAALDGVPPVRQLRCRTGARTDREGDPYFS
jgi:predicted nucleic acid-binding Zn ribbon protein